MTIPFITTHRHLSSRARLSYLNEVEELALGGREVRLRRGVLRVALFGRTL